ncbi:hypothetical protein RHAL1_P00006 (plasmid) [Beijerinckiaceae bacterium RH AL1]|nr:hypothetical protein RHAL1_P00006 [Beijerinckiaceae bacterium RH AL1]
MRRHAEADARAEKLAHRPSRRSDRRLLANMVRIEPGAMHAGDPTFAVRDGCDQRRERAPGRFVIVPIVAARVKAQGADVRYHRIDAALAQIDVGKRARDRFRHRKQTTC